MIQWTQCPLCLGHAVDRNDSSIIGVSCPDCGDLSQRLCTKLEKIRRELQEAWKPFLYDDESGLISMTLQDAANLMRLLGLG